MAQEYEASIEELKGEVKARGALVEQQGGRLREMEERIETMGADRQVTQLRTQLEANPNPNPNPSPNPNPNGR